MGTPSLSCECPPWGLVCRWGADTALHFPPGTGPALLPQAHRLCPAHLPLGQSHSHGAAGVGGPCLPPHHKPASESGGTPSPPAPPVPCWGRDLPPREPPGLWQDGCLGGAPPATWQHSQPPSVPRAQTPALIPPGLKPSLISPPVPWSGASPPPPPTSRLGDWGLPGAPCTVLGEPPLPWGSP